MQQTWTELRRALAEVKLVAGVAGVAGAEAVAGVAGGMASHGIAVYDEQREDVIRPQAANRN